LRQGWALSLMSACAGRRRPASEDGRSEELRAGAGGPTNDARPSVCAGQGAARSRMCASEWADLWKVSFPGWVLAPSWGAGIYNRGIPGPSLCCVPGLGSWGPLGGKGCGCDVVRDAIPLGLGELWGDKAGTLATPAYADWRDYSNAALWFGLGRRFGPRRSRRR
jgi:hypothetical protein